MKSFAQDVPRVGEQRILFWSSFDGAGFDAAGAVWEAFLGDGRQQWGERLVQAALGMVAQKHLEGVQDFRTFGVRHDIRSYRKADGSVVDDQRVASKLNKAMLGQCGDNVGQSIPENLFELPVVNIASRHE